MLLNVVKATANPKHDNRSQTIRENAKKISDNPQNLVLVEGESTKSRIPFATDPQKISPRGKRLLIKSFLQFTPQLAPYLGEVMNGILTDGASSKLGDGESLDRVEILDRFNETQIAEIYNKIIVREDFSKTVAEIKKKYSETDSAPSSQHSQEKAEVLGLLDQISGLKGHEQSGLSGEESRFLRSIEHKKDLRSDKSFSSQKTVDINELATFINQQRHLGITKISLQDSEFKDAKLVGDFSCYGILADLSDSPNLKSEYSRYENNPLFGKPNIKMAIRDIDFSGVDFRGANINIDELRFENCNFKDAIMPSSQNAEFIKSNLQGTDWSNTSQKALCIGYGGPEAIVKYQLMILHDIFPLDESPEIIGELSKKIEPFMAVNPVMNVSGANFAGCELINPSFFRANFVNSNFNQAGIFNEWSEDAPFLLKDCEGLNFEGAKYEMRDSIAGESPRIKQFSGLTNIDLEKLKERCKEIYGEEKSNRLFTEFSTDGYFPNELLEKLRDNKKIVVKININPDRVDRYITGFESSKQSLIPQEHDNISKNAIRFLSKLFGQYNFEFVDENYQQNVDYNVDIGIVSMNYGISYGEISRGNTTILFGGKSVDDKFKPNYYAMAHELLHSMTGFVTFGVHSYLMEPNAEVGMSNFFCGTLTSTRAVDIVTPDGKLRRINFNEFYSQKGEDQVTPCVYDQNHEFLDYLGREKIEVTRVDIDHKVDKDRLTNFIFFQEFPEKENRVAIDAELKETHDISVHRAKDIIKFCRIPSINFCIDNHNIKEDERVIIFMPKQPDLDPQIIYVSGGKKEIKIGEEVLYSDSNQLHQSSLLSIMNSSAPQAIKSTPQPLQETYQDAQGQSSRENTPSPANPSQENNRLMFLNLLLAIPAAIGLYCFKNRNNNIVQQGQGLTLARAELVQINAQNSGEQSMV